MQDELFQIDAHDPGGKIRTRLPAGMYGDAEFWGDRSQYRPVLRRWAGRERFSNVAAGTLRYALFIGMNPSTADAMVNDPTITREWGFSTREGFGAYVKCNLSDYRATKPADLLAAGLTIQSPVNVDTIHRWAKGADLVVAAWGAISKPLQPLATDLCTWLQQAGIPIYCLGNTADGHPRHPLYLKTTAPLQPFRQHRTASFAAKDSPH